MNQKFKSRFWHRPQREGILIVDMSQCKPQSAISSRSKDGCWYTLPYEVAVHGVEKKPFEIEEKPVRWN